MDLTKLGWNNDYENAFAELKGMGYKPGRIFAEYKNMYKIICEDGELLAEISGKLHFGAEHQEDFPAVGDWVAVTIRPNEGRATIHNILPRKSKFSRKAAGTNTREQIVAANIDTVFIVNSLNKDFNLRRIERYLLLAWESGANPVIVLSKSDLCDDVEEKLAEVEAIAIGVPVHAVSSYSAAGLDDLRKHFKEGHTIALLGSSGVGKSSIINYFLGGEVQRVQELRTDGQKGKHTSTHREMFILPDGGLIIDTPGMRELQLWDAEEGLQEAFEDIEALAAGCFFRDCRHENEPGCAIREAIESGSLLEERLGSYKKLQKELLFLERKQSIANKSAQRRSKTKTSESKAKAFDYDLY